MTDNTDNTDVSEYERESESESNSMLNTITGYGKIAKNYVSSIISNSQVVDISKQCFEVGKGKLYHMFTDHPSSKNMTYFQHFYGSFTYFLFAFGASIAFLCHGLFPFLFETGGSDMTVMLINRLEADGVVERKDNSDNDSSNEDNESDNSDNDNDNENESSNDEYNYQNNNENNSNKDNKEDTKENGNDNINTDNNAENIIE